MNLTPEERERRREVARRLVAEGKIGGAERARRGGLAKAQRASQLAARMIEQHAEQIEAALLDGLHSPRRSERVRAAEMVLRLGLRAEAQTTAETRATLEHLDRQQLIDHLARSLSAGPVAELLRERVRGLPGQIEGRAVELPADPPEAA